MSTAVPRLSHTAKTVIIILGAALSLTLWLEILMVRDPQIFAVLCIVMSLGIALVAFRQARGGRWAALGGLALGAAGVHLVWVFGGWFPWWILSLSLTALLGLASWFLVWTLHTRPTEPERARLSSGLLRAAGLIVALIAGAVSTGLIALVANPAPVAAAIQASAGFNNSFQPERPRMTEVRNGAQLTNDIQYGQKYPNSFLDVYIADNDPSEPRPTVVIVHGGGFVGGSKSSGDPNAPGTSAQFAVGNGSILGAGYNVVAINYALAPQYSYPTPVEQLGEAMQFLQGNGASFGLDMSEVVFSGGSAGGHIIGQYINIQTNADYAAEMGLPQTMNPSTIKAAVFDSALFDVGRSGQTQAPVIADDFQYAMSVRSYGYPSKEFIEEANIIDHATSAFPPSFITDGNTGTFSDQAFDFASKLTELGVQNETYLPPASEAELAHGYMIKDPASVWSQEYEQRKIAFLNNILR